MTSRTKVFQFLIIVALVFSAALVALADPPSRVARLQYTQGQISVQPGGVDDWIEVNANRPLTTADRVWADKESRAELHLGNAFMRIDAETSLTLTNVSDATVQLELDQGTLNVRVRHLYDDEIYEIDTPNLAFTISKAGEYRFDVDPNNDTTYVTVWKGRGDATGEGRSVEVNRGEQAKFSGGTSLEHQMYDQPDRDGFDDWCRVRDRHIDESQSARYVSPDVIGAEDLDQYGSWRVVPTYGAVWVPAVAPGWAPYHDGHWVWVDPWGWTWVDDAPWGFAPAHYGRWAYYGGSWAWVPGPVEVRPVYAPALVAWVGGASFGVAVTSGEPVGWFPLGYGEPYVPPYGASRQYFEHVNVSNTKITNITVVTNNYYNNNTRITNVTNVTNVHYANQRVPGAVMAVPRSAMVSSQSVARSSIQIPPGQLRHVSVAVAPSVAPDRESVLGARAGRPAAVPPARVMEPRRPVVSHVAPPPRPVPFEAKQQALQNHPGRPLDRDDEEKIRTQIARQPAGPHGNEGLHRGQEGTQPGHDGFNRGQEEQPRNAAVPRPGQPNSNIRVDGRVPVPAEGRQNNGRGPDEGRPNNGRGPDKENDRPGPAAGRAVPRPPQRNEQAVQPAQERPVGRPVETRSNANDSQRSPEPTAARPGQGRLIEQPENETRSVPRPPQAGGNSGNQPMNAAPENNGRGQGRMASQSSSPEEHAVPQPPQRGNSGNQPMNAAPENNGRGQGRMAPQSSSPEEHSVPQPPQRGNSMQSAPPRDVQPSAPQVDSAPAPNRGNSGARQEHSNSAPARDQGSNNPAPRPSQPEYRTVSAPQQSTPAAHNEAPAHSAPAHDSNGNSSKGEKSKDKH